MTPDELADGWPDDPEVGIPGGERFDDERPDPLVGRGLGLAAAGGVALVFCAFALVSVLVRGFGGQLPTDASALWGALAVPGALLVFGLVALLLGRRVQRREATAGRLRARRGGVGTGR